MMLMGCQLNVSGAAEIAKLEYSDTVLDSEWMLLYIAIGRYRNWSVSGDQS